MPTDEFEATLGYTRISQDGINTALNPNTAPSLAASLLGADRQPRDHTARVNDDVTFLLDTEVFTGDAKWSPGGIDIKLLGGVQRHRNFGRNDFDGSNAPIITFSAPLAADVQTAELQFLSNDESWASDWLESIAGLYYFHSDIGLDPILDLFGGSSGSIQLFQSLPAIGVEALINGLPAGLRNVIAPLPLTGGVSIALSSFVETESGAAFAQSTAHLTDWLALTLGARYQVEKREATKSTFGLNGADGTVTPVFDFVNNPLFANQTDLSKKTSFFSPKVSLSVTPVDDVLIYASWQKANKSGTYNAVNIYDAIDYAEPEEIKAVELGLKSEFLGGLVRFNTAVFEAKIDNLQVQFVSLFNGGAVSIENAASARTRGVEFDTLLLLFPDAIEGLVFTASGAYVDATYISYPNASGFNETTGFYNFGTGDYSGNPSVRTPKWSGTAALSKTTSFDRFTVETAVDAYYSDRFSYLAQNSLFFQDSFYLINARVSALYNPWNVRVTLFGDNLNDAVHDIGQFPNDFGRLNVLAPPRSYGMRLTWTFE